MRLRLTAVGALVLFGFVMAASPPVSVFADHEDGGLYDWGSGIGYLLDQALIDGIPLSVCSDDFPVSTAAAVGAWNDALGLENDAFSYSGTCGDTFIEVVSSDPLPGGQANCGGAHACIVFTGWNDEDDALVFPATVHMYSPLFTDGNSHTTQDVVHELGHALGYGHRTCTGGDTVMDTTDPHCGPTTPTARDLALHHSAYHADAVSSLSTTVTSQRTVGMTWNPAAIHNEKQFQVWRTFAHEGIWQLPWYGGRNTSATGSMSVAPAGWWYYGTWSANWADNEHYFWGDEVGSWVYIPPTTSPPATPTNVTCWSAPGCEFTDNATNEDRFLVQWWRWNGSDWDWVENQWQVALAGSGGSMEAYLMNPDPYGSYYGAWGGACSDSGDCSDFSDFYWVWYQE